MMERDFRYRDGVAIAQIPPFAVFLFLGFLILYQRKDGWFGMIFFPIIRLIGASCMLATLRDDRDAVWAGSFVCESLGLVILTYMLLNLLHRVNLFLLVLTKWHFRIPDLICWAGIGVTAADFILASRQDDALKPNAMTIAGLALFVAVYGWALLLFALCARLWTAVPADERRPLLCFAVSIPFMAVRVSYSMAYACTGDEKYSAVVGDATVYLFMTYLCEVVMTALIAWTVLSMPRPPTAEEARDRKGRRADSRELLSRDESR